MKTTANDCFSVSLQPDYGFAPNSHLAAFLAVILVAMQLVAASPFAQADNTIDPNATGANDVVLDPRGAAVTLTNPLADPLDLGETWLAIGNTSNGELLIDGGSELTNDLSILGYSEGSSGKATVRGADSRWDSQEGIWVGRYGQGILKIEAGGVLSNYGSLIGAYSDSAGEVTLSGNSSRWDISHYLSLGSQGEGTLFVSEGGTLTDKGGIIGVLENAVGSATVKGNGSRWLNSEELDVGAYGQGNLTIIEGGLVTSGSGRVGAFDYSTGIVTVTGSGSRWDSTRGIGVGDHGSGALYIFNSGTVTSRGVGLGLNSRATGIVVVNGLGSLWEISGTLMGGAEGSSTLAVEGGGVVRSITGYLGYSYNSTSIATVTGNGSKWINSGSLYLGNNESLTGDTGTLDVLDGGFVSVGETLKLRKSGTLHLVGGAIQAGVIDAVLGTIQWADGRLSTDQFLGDLTQDAGTWAIGNSSNKTFLEGNYALDDEGVLEIEFGRTGLRNPLGMDWLEVSGSVALGGTLEVLLSDDDLPQAGSVFELLTAQQVTGTFDEVHLPALPEEMSWHLSYNDTSVRLSFNAVPEPTSFALLSSLGVIAWSRRRVRQA